MIINVTSKTVVIKKSSVTSDTAAMEGVLFLIFLSVFRLEYLGNTTVYQREIELSLQNIAAAFIAVLLLFYNISFISFILE